MITSTSKLIFTKTITNRVTNNFDEYQISGQARFWKNVSTNKLIQILHLAFMYYNKAFNSVELWTVFEALKKDRFQPPEIHLPNMENFKLKFRTF